MLIRSFACLTILPPLYIAIAMAHGHMDYPFWDHIEVTRYIASAMHGRLRFADLIAQHNEHRPATYRALVVSLALLDGWNMQVETAGLWVLMAATFATLAGALHRSARDSRAFLISVPGLAAVVFSPAAHNNQWWGMMLALQLAALFLTLGFVLHALGPRRPWPNIGAGIALTLAGYSLANGVVAFIALAGASLLVQRSFRLTAAWSAATIAFLVLYLHGFTSPTAVYAGLGAVIIFTLAALGTPLAALIRFPYTTQFEIPTETTFPAIIGAALVSLWIIVAVWRITAQRNDEATTFGISAGLFAVGNAALTGYGRAALDTYGVASANSSRYVTFNAFLLYALLAFAVSTPMRTAVKRGLSVSYVAMLCVAATAYAASWQTFSDVAEFDVLLGNAYRDFDTEDDVHHWIFPNSEHAAEMIGLMRELRIGPYRLGGELKVPPAKEALSKPASP